MRLTLQIQRLEDPDGHNPALLLKGDWIMIGISDGVYTGWGEASHSKNDQACIKTAESLFKQHIIDLDLSLASIRTLEQDTFAHADNFIQATAISGLNQALYALLALRQQIPCHQLICEKPTTKPVPVYTTINRALNVRDLTEYFNCIAAAIDQGFNAIKCAPFELVTKDGPQIEQAQDGIQKLKAIRQEFPGLSIRVDFHERFQLDNFLHILPMLSSLQLTWIEAPCPINSDYARLRQEANDCMALGELYYAFEGFSDIIQGHWADIIMPDVKHVGGFGPLVNVIEKSPAPISISPHNPSGPIATLASLHAAQVGSQIHSLELPLILDRQRAYYLDWLTAGALQIPPGSGWGASLTKFICSPD